MSAEKPLHVRVAEALGWLNIRKSTPSEERGDVYVGVPPERWPNIVSEPIPRYDTDWSATGPLIELFHIDVEFDETDHWLAYSDPVFPYGEGATPLIAVCDLILALHAAGKLNA